MSLMRELGPTTQLSNGPSVQVCCGPGRCWEGLSSMLPSRSLHRRAAAGVGATAVTMLVASTPALAASAVHIRVSVFSGAATLTEDIGAKTDTPIFFTEQVSWSL